jgi:hypothetical protein
MRQGRGGNGRGNRGGGRRGGTGGAGSTRPSSRGPGRMGGRSAAGPGGSCVCSSCGHREPHVAGEPCYGKKCPECGANMTRG